MENLTLVQYKKMVKTVMEFKKLNGKLPEYTDVDGHHINKTEYIDMIETVNKFLLEMGRNPSMVDIEPSGNSFENVLIY